MLDSTVAEFWRARTAADAADGDAELRLAVIADAPEPLALLERADGGAQVCASAAAATRLELVDRPVGSVDALRARLAEAGLELDEPAFVFHYPQGELDAARTEANAPLVRPLDEHDAEAFVAFHAAASEEERDAAFVELDHWAVVGAVDGDTIAAVSSAFPWEDGPLADIGVLTAPSFRGRGHARAVVRAMSRIVLERDHQPLYRCAVDNAASAAVARSAGMVRFGTWSTLPAADD